MQREPNNSIQRMRASRLCHLQLERPRRLARTADAARSPMHLLKRHLVWLAALTLIGMNTGAADSQIPNKCIGGHRIHQGQPSSETKIASTKYVYVPLLLASSISYRPGWAGTLIQNVLD